MARGETFPDRIREISGAVIEYVHTNARIMSAGEKSVAGAQAGADDAEIVEALLFSQSKQERVSIDGLAGGVDGAADIR